MTDIRNAYAARYEAATPAGRAMQEDLAALPPEMFERAYADAHRGAFGYTPGMTRAGQTADAALQILPGGAGMIEQPQPGGGDPMAPGYDWEADARWRAAGSPMRDPGSMPQPVERMVGSALEGVSRSVWELGRTMRDIADSYVKNSGGQIKQFFDQAGVQGVENYDAMPDLVENKNMAEGFTSGLSQFLGPFLAFSKTMAGMNMFRSMGVQAPAWAEAAARGAVASVPVDFAFIDPIENNLVQLAKDFGFESELTNALLPDADPDADAQLMNRVKAAAINVGLGAAVEAAPQAVMMAVRGVRSIRGIQWEEVEREGYEALRESVGQAGRLNDVTSAPEIAAKQAAAVAKIVAGRIGRLGVNARKKFERTGEMPGVAELTDGLVSQGADPMAVRQGIDQGLANYLQPDEHTLDVDKREGGRSVLRRVALPREIKAVIETKAPSRRAAAGAMSRVRETMARYPAREGWVEIAPKEVTFKSNGEVDKVKWTAKNEGEGRFMFHLDPATGKADKKTADARAEALANIIAAEVRDVERRAAQGDRNARVIQRQRAWYTGMRDRLREEFGGAGQVFAELLGATSPNTAVPQNWDNAVEALRGMVRGDYDEQLRKLEAHIEAGKPMNEFPADDKITKATGKLFGMNSGGAMRAMLDMWKAIEPGSAPKAKNFAGNLIGTSDKATIDVWAARMLQRVAGRPRLPALLEAAVPGNWNANATAVTGPYGFGVDVFNRAAAKLGMKPHELQAYTWFAEKERWAREHWTTADGEGGSFEQMADAAGFTRFQAGVSVQQAEPPTDELVAEAGRRIQQSLADDKAVIGYRALPTTGMYAGSRERAFDAEITAKPEWNPTRWVSDLASVAKENNQYDVLVSRVLKADEPSENARPGIEVYFRDQQSLDQIMPLIDQITAAGQNGFTFAVDPRMRMRTADGAEAGQYIGVRLQFVPEIAMRWDDALREELAANPDKMVELVTGKTDQMIDLVAQLQQAEGVLSAHRFDYDSFVMGRENYDEYISRDAGGGSGAGEAAAWFGRSYRDHIAAATRRLVGGERAGNVPESGDLAGEQASPGEVAAPDGGPSVNDGGAP